MAAAILRIGCDRVRVGARCSMGEASGWLNRAMPPVPELTPEQHRRRRKLSRAWAFLVIGWAFGRTLVVWAAVGDYGLNPFWYLTIDLVCASVDAFTTPKTALALVDTRYSDAALWGTASIVAFLLPDLYIFLATDELPNSIIAIIVGVVVATLGFTVFGMVKKVHAGRVARAAECRATAAK